MSDSDLARFIDAQDLVFQRVIDELSLGKKQTHWIWFIFPQLRGLGWSPKAVLYGIENLDEAGRYLSHPILGERLRRCVRLMLSHKHKTAFEILGSPDDLKFRSCLTLFLTAGQNDEDLELFTEALDVFFDGESDPLTISAI
ncbi:MAG: DUF1810 domain-containing protein [Rhizobiaceae bacterium]